MEPKLLRLCASLTVSLVELIDFNRLDILLSESVGSFPHYALAEFRVAFREIPTMNTMLSVEARETALAVTFPSGETVCYPWLWLKDNAPSSFHPETEERIFDLTSVEPSLKPLRVEERSGTVGIVWSER